MVLPAKVRIVCSKIDSLGVKIDKMDAYSLKALNVILKSRIFVIEIILK